MAEADPDCETEADTELPPDGTKRISLLMLTPRWQFDTYAMASMTRSLVNDLWLADPDGHKIQVTCVLLDEDGKISEADIADAKLKNVSLRGAKRPRGDIHEESIEWIDTKAINYYYHLVSVENPFDFIVGHVPYTAYGAFNMQDICTRIGQKPKVILVIHALPKTKHGDVDRMILASWLHDSDMILSVGHGVEAEIKPYLEDMEEREKPIPIMYVPHYPLRLLTIKQPTRTLNGKHVITMMVTERKNLDISGLNYELAVAAVTRAVDSILSLEGFDSRNQIRMEFMVIAANQKERDSWEREFNEIKETEPTKYKGITFQFYQEQSIDELKSLLKQTTVLLLPLKPSSPLFGIEALCAASAGTPVLVSSNSGVASLFQFLGESKPILYNTGKLFVDAEMWKRRIIDRITNPEESHNEAKEIRSKLIQDTTVASSHLHFIQEITSKCDG